MPGFNIYYSGFLDGDEDEDLQHDFSLNTVLGGQRSQRLYSLIH